MKQSFLAAKTNMNAPADADCINAKLLTQAGFIKKEMAGVYSYLPLGFRVLEKIKKIIVEEMDNVGMQQTLMPALTPLENWKKTGRDNVDIAYRPTENTVLGFSHEEIVTPLIKEIMRSYKDFPKCLYQIQTKFRNEARAKSGLLRGREFIMKDAYSFHTSEEDFKQYYDKVAEAYFRVYERCGLESYKIEASGGIMSGEEKISHEYSVVTKAGEDTMVFCKKCGFAQNIEISKKRKGDDCPNCKNSLNEEKCIEVGNIFDLGSKYSDAFGFHFTDTDGKQKPVHMGCYGIGVSRLMGTIVEASHDENGIIWPQTVAPFQLHILSLRENEKAEEITSNLEEDGFEILYDDRNESPGKKFADSDLLGIPLRVVVSKRMLEKGCVELRNRKTGETQEIPTRELQKYISTYFMPIKK